MIAKAAMPQRTPRHDLATRRALVCRRHGERSGAQGNRWFELRNVRSVRLQRGGPSQRQGASGAAIVAALAMAPRMFEVPRRSAVQDRGRVGCSPHPVPEGGNRAAG